MLARTLSGEAARFQPPAPATRLKVPGVELFAAGEVDGSEPLLVRDPARGIYRRLDFLDGRLIGALLLGDTAGGPMLHELISRRTHIGDAPETRSRIAFGMPA